jgi:hypothetical protein
MKTAKQARRIADQAAGKLPTAMQAAYSLRSLLDTLGLLDDENAKLPPGARAVLNARLGDLDAALQALENVVGVETPAALFE